MLIRILQHGVNTKKRMSASNIKNRFFTERKKRIFYFSFFFSIIYGMPLTDKGCQLAKSAYQSQRNNQDQYRIKSGDTMKDSAGKMAPCAVSTHAQVAASFHLTSSPSPSHSARP
jgi:hypothetical protein